MLAENGRVPPFLVIGTPMTQTVLVVIVLLTQKRILKDSTMATANHQVVSLKLSKNVLEVICYQDAVIKWRKQEHESGQRLGDKCDILRCKARGARHRCCY